MTVVVVTSPLSLARNLWRYGEPALADAALEFSAEQIADIGVRAGALMDDTRCAALWDRIPTGGYVVLAAIEAVEGSIRAPSRTRRKPEKQLPAKFVATEEELWSDPLLWEVSSVHDKRRRPS